MIVVARCCEADEQRNKLYDKRLNFDDRESRLKISSEKIIYSLLLLVFTFILRRNSGNEKKIAVGIRMFSFGRDETENA